MSYKYKFLFSTIFIIVSIFACSPGLYIPTITDSQHTGISTDSLKMGRNLYIDNCGSCHSLYKPELYSKKELEKILPTMKRKAKCNTNDMALITKYLYARAKQD